MWLPPIARISNWDTECVWEGLGRGVLNSKRSPKCGILSSKLRSPVCKERRRRRWGCGSVRAVSVWPAHVTCLVAESDGSCKGAGHPGNGGCYGAGRHGGGSGCQLVYEVVWWGTFTGITGQMHWALFPLVPVVSTASHKGNGPPRFVFQICPSVGDLLELIFGECGAKKGVKKKRLLEM